MNYPYFPHPPRVIPRIAPRCPQNPLQVLMTFPIVNLLVHFNLEGSLMLDTFLS
jgi:hypothetical protein